MAAWDFHTFSVYALALYGFIELVIRLVFGLTKSCLAEYYDLRNWRRKFRE